MSRKIPTANNRLFKFDSKEAPKYYAAVKLNSEGKSLAASRDGGIGFNYADFILRHKMPLLLFDT